MTIQIQEAWKDVVGYEGLYMVSNFGNVKSLSHIDNMGRVKTGCILSQMFDGKKNYLHVNLYKNGKHKTAQVHRLVAQAFLRNPNNLKIVNHKDETKTNNCVGNLEWCTSKYNNNYGKMRGLQSGEKNNQCKINKSIVEEIRKLCIPGDELYGITALAKKYNLSISHVSNIANNKRWVVN